MKHQITSLQIDTFYIHVLKMQKTSLGIGSNCHISTGWTQKSAIFVWNLWPYYVSRSHAKKSQLHMFVFQVCKLSYWETNSPFIIKCQYQPNIKNILIQWMSSNNNRVVDNYYTQLIRQHLLYLTKDLYTVSTKLT